MSLLKNNNKKIKINNVEFKIIFYLYNNGRYGFKLINPTNNNLEAICTINYSKYEVNKNEVIIKDYNQNKGIYKALLNSGLIKKSHNYCKIGNNKGLFCYINEDFKFI